MERAASGKRRGMEKFLFRLDFGNTGEKFWITS